MTTARDNAVNAMTWSRMSREDAEQVIDQVVAEASAAAYRKAAAAVLADTDHIPHGSATDYAERHAALISRMADAAEAGDR